MRVGSEGYQPQRDHGHAEEEVLRVRLGGSSAPAGGPRGGVGHLERLREGRIRADDSQRAHGKDLPEPLYRIRSVK